jgi:hypothetical protein
MGYLGNSLLQPWFIGDFITGKGTHKTKQIKIENQITVNNIAFYKRWLGHILVMVEQYTFNISFLLD